MISLNRSHHLTLPPKAIFSLMGNISSMWEVPTRPSSKPKTFPTVISPLMMWNSAGEIEFLYGCSGYCIKKQYLNIDCNHNFHIRILFLMISPYLNIVFSDSPTGTACSPVRCHQTATSRRSEGCREETSPRKRG